MRKWLKLCWPPLAAAGVLLFVMAGPFEGQEKKDPGKHGSKELYSSLRDVINTGADLFNVQNDYAGCYRLYHGALLSVKPFLPPELQKEIALGIAKAEAMPRVSDRAFELRRVIDLVRGQVKDGPIVLPKDKLVQKDKIVDKAKDKDKIADKDKAKDKDKIADKDKAKDKDKIADKDKAKDKDKIADKDKAKDKAKDKDKIADKDKAKDKDKPAPAKTLWDRLGGEDNVAKVVDDFVLASASDPKVNVTRDGKIKANADDLKVQLIAFISHHTGGPYKYTGKSMKDAHKGMAITNAEFDAAGGHMSKALAKHKVAPADADAFMALLGGMRKDIVEGSGKKDGPKKDDVKKVDGPKKDGPAKDGAKKVDGPKKDGPAKDGVKKVDVPKKDGPAKDEVKKDAPAEKAAKLSGKATLQGKPLTAAYVTFVAENNRKFTTFIQADGSYGFRTPIPFGQYKVFLEAAGGSDGARTAIPTRYTSVATSGLTVRIEAATSNFDIELQN